MKKFISIVLLCVLLLTLVSCGGDSGTTDKTNPDGEVNTFGSTETETVGQHNNNSTTSKNETPKVDEYDEYVTIPRSEILVYYKSKRYDTGVLNGMAFYNAGKDGVLFLYDAPEYSGTVDDIFALIDKGNLPKKMIGYMDAEVVSAGNYPITINKTEKTRVASYDCIRFDGSFTDDNGRVCFAYGYTFVIDTRPCMFVGFVFTEEQTKDEKDSIIAEVDKMMETVRTER